MPVLCLGTEVNLRKCLRDMLAFTQGEFQREGLSTCRMDGSLILSGSACGRAPKSTGLLLSQGRSLPKAG